MKRGLWAACVALAMLFAGAAHAAGETCVAQPMPGQGFVAAVQRNLPAVVQVVALRGSRDPMEGESFEFFQPLAGLPLPAGEALDRTFSSGFIIDADGLVVASAHAVFDAREIWVLTADGRRLRARVLGFDRSYDVSLLRIDAAGLPIVHAAKGSHLCPGAWIAAIGTPFGFDRTVTAGIVSAYPRFLHGSSIPLIQTDAVLNPGSSGGPLFDAEGMLIGMSTMIYSANGIYIGVSFALPVAELMRVVEALRTTGSARRGEIGARTQPVTADLARAFGLDAPSGALVVSVEAGGPAARAGLKAGDVVLGLARGERTGHAEIEAKIAAAAPGTPFEADVWRNDAIVHAAVLVAAAASPLPPAPQVRLASNEPRLGLGLTTSKLAPGMPPGLYVDSATGSALLAGLERGDRIVAVNGTPVDSVAEFDAALAHVRQRGVVALLVVRGGAMVYLPVSREGLSPG